MHLQVLVFIAGQSVKYVFLINSQQQGEVWYFFLEVVNVILY